MSNFEPIGKIGVVCPFDQYFTIECSVNVIFCILKFTSKQRWYKNKFFLEKLLLDLVLKPGHLDKNNTELRYHCATTMLHSRWPALVRVESLRAGPECRPLLYTQDYWRLILYIIKSIKPWFWKSQKKKRHLFTDSA